MNNPDHISESLNFFCQSTVFKFYDVHPGSVMEKIRIRDGKKSDPGSGMQKSRIQDKHPGSATLFSAKIVVTQLFFYPEITFFTGFGFAMGFFQDKNFAKLILRMTNYYDMMNERTTFVRNIPQKNIEQVISYKVKLKIPRDVS
jgi:hypothetical protein